MKNKIVEHKIVKEKNYLIAFIFGSLWTALAFGISVGFGWILKVGTGQMLMVGIFSTLSFCYGIHLGYKSGFYDAEEIETVEHIIKEVKGGMKK